MFQTFWVVEEQKHLDTEQYFHSGNQVNLRPPVCLSLNYNLLNILQMNVRWT